MTQRRWCLGTAMPGTPRTHGPSPHGVGALPWVNDRTSAEASLPAEAAAFLPAHLCVREEQYGCGILLLYRHETWHRGTPLLPGALRVVVNLTFRKEGAEWVSQLPAGRSWAMYRRGMQMECLVAAVSVDARCVLGSPATWHPYWTHATVAVVKARAYGPLGMTWRRMRFRWMSDGFLELGLGSARGWGGDLYSLIVWKSVHRNWPPH